MTSTFGMFAKFPEPGRVKTRLASAIGPSRAAELYRAFVEDLVAKFRGAADRRVLAFAPNTESTHVFFAKLAGTHYELWPQPDTSLEQRMESFFDRYAAGPVVLIGSDSPTLPQEFVELALQKLQQADCVLGPATDGGVYLIGLRSGWSRLFERVEWSTSRVLAQCIDGAKRHKVSVEVLPPWYDVDTLDDLNFLYGHIAAWEQCAPPHWQSLSQTRAVLDVIGNRPSL